MNKSNLLTYLYATISKLTALDKYQVAHTQNNQKVKYFVLLIQSNLVIRNHFPWTIANLLHKNKENLALRNNFRLTKNIYANLCFDLMLVIIVLKKENLSFLQGFQDEKRLTGVLQHTYHTKFQAISANLSVNRCVSALSQWSPQLCEVAYHIRQWYLCGVRGSWPIQLVVSYPLSWLTQPRTSGTTLTSVGNNWKLN